MPHQNNDTTTANLQTLISDRLILMQQQTLSIKRQKNNLYTHLCELLTHLPLSSDAKNRKVDSVKELAAISEYVKNCSYREREAEPLDQKQLNQVISRRNKDPLWFSKKRQLLAYNQKIQHQDSIKLNTQLQNFQKSHSSLFSPSGISFGNEQALRISIAIKKLRQKVNANKLRFWGKILTRKSDYYIVQGVVANKKNGQKRLQKDDSMQGGNQGANMYSYWVNSLTCKSIGYYIVVQNEWYELPLITPAQLKASRLIKYTFTGDLHAQIKSYPKFTGSEEHLLKCQLVRITHNCEIAPKGMYGPTQQSADEIEFVEDYKLPTQFTQLSNLQNWVHLNPYILQLGRCSYWTDAKLPEDQRQQLMNKLSQTDPKQQRLKQINEDKPPSIQSSKGVETAWFVKQVGSVQVYNNVGKDEGTTSCYGLVSMRNVNWPGWVTVSGLGVFDSVYVGYGWKATQGAFWPVGCEDLQVQGEDVGENDEPNPSNPPDQLEPDSDDQNKKVDE